MDYGNALNHCLTKPTRRKLAGDIELIAAVCWMESSSAYAPVANGAISHTCMATTVRFIATFNIGVPLACLKKSGHSSSRSATNCKA